MKEKQVRNGPSPKLRSHGVHERPVNDWLIVGKQGNKQALPTDLFQLDY